MFPSYLVPVNRLRELIESGHSKKATHEVIAWVGNDPTRFKELVGLLSGMDRELARRAAWSFSYIATAHPELGRLAMKDTVKLLTEQGLHDGIYRNLNRFLQTAEIPEAIEGIVAETALLHLRSPEAAVAVKAFAMTTLENLIRKYPELAPEVVAVVEDQMDYATAALKVRAARLMKTVDRLRANQ